MGRTSVNLTSKQTSKGKKRDGNKILRQSGKSYHDGQGNTVEEKKFKFVNCNCQYKCSTAVRFDKRKNLFDRFWKLSNWDAQSVFLKSNVVEVRIVLVPFIFLNLYAHLLYYLISYTI